MSLLEQASLVVTPNGYKASKLYSVVPNTTLGDMNVVRATTATRVNSAGLIESVASNVPRLDYTNGSCPSILVEPQRTNLILNSATVATQTITTTAVATTVSFYGTGTITFSGTYIGSLVGTGVNNRVTLTFTPTAGSLILTVVGSCTKGQLETGSYSTSYIPTVASTVTRNADVISKTGISSLIGQTEGTLFLDLFASAQNSDSVPGFSVLSDIGTGVNRIQIYTNNGFIGFIIYNPSALVVASSFNITPNTNIKVALGYSSGATFMFVNGTQVATTAAALSLSGLDAFTLNKVFDANLSAKNNYNEVVIWKTKLSNTELSQLTTL
jgi:hypothetical protein